MKNNDKKIDIKKADEMCKVYEEFHKYFDKLSKKYDSEALLKGGVFAALENLLECAPTKQLALESIFAMIEMIVNKNVKSGEEKIFKVEREKIHELSEKVH